MELCCMKGLSGWAGRIVCVAKTEGGRGEWRGGEEIFFWIERVCGY